METTLKQKLFAEADYCFECANDIFFDDDERAEFANRRVVLEEIFKTLGLMSEYMGIA